MKMPILHKFNVVNWENGFETQNAILNILPYKPEVMIVGTFNPDIPTNPADFFYGRNFFWPAFSNLFTYDRIFHLNRRMPVNGPPLPHHLRNPTLAEILCLCLKLRLTFSDLILNLFNSKAQYEILNDLTKIQFNQRVYSLYNDADIEELNQYGQVNWNTENIIDYLCQNESIKYVYFTRRPVGIWEAQWKTIINHKCMQKRICCNIYSPTAMGAPVLLNINNLLSHWVHNVNEGFGRLNNDWLVEHGVTLTNF